MDILPQLIVNSLIAGGIYALLAMSFNLIFGTTKFFNFAHGSFALIGGYIVFYLSKTHGLNSYLSVLIALVASGLCATALDKAIFLPLRKRKASGMIKLVASLGLFSIAQAAVAMIFTSQFQSLTNRSKLENIYNIGNAAITQTQVVIIFLSLIVLVILILLLKFTLFGKAVNAISDDEEVAKIVGINTNQIISKVFLLGGGIAALAGILVGFDTGLDPTIGLHLFLKGVIAAIVGGLGSIEGAFLGAFLLSFAENFGIWKISGEWKDAIAFGLLIIFLLFRPQGIVKK